MVCDANVFIIGTDSECVERPSDEGMIMKLDSAP